MHLWCNFYVRLPLFDEAQLHALQSVINETLPQWSSGLAHPTARTPGSDLSSVKRGVCHAGVHRIAPVKNNFGDVVLTGAYKGLAFFMDHSNPTLPVELNRMSAEVYGLDVVEGQSTSAWARHYVERMVARMPVRYARARTREEYEAKKHG